MSTFNNLFADRMHGVSGNVIREILKLTQTSDVISFAGGLPSPDSFPAEDLKLLLQQSFDDSFDSLLQYSTSEGYPPLREYLASWVVERGIKATPDEVAILAGSQQGIDLACKAFINAGDTVLVERPTYLAALQIFSLYQANVVSVPGDSDGMDPAALEEAIKKHRPKMLYVIPTFRNPSGETWTGERRQQIAQIAADANVVVIEDDPYGLLRYSGQPTHALKAYDTVGNVIYLGSFSKIVSPGLRIGYAIASPDVLRRMIIGKQATDVHTNNLGQYLVNAFCRSPRFSAHLQQACENYGQKRDRMLQNLEAHFPEGVEWTRPEGGLFLWVTLPEEVNTEELLEQAVEEKVAFIPGTPFYTDGSGHNSMRLNFSNATFQEIDDGIERLAKVLAQAMVSGSPR